MYSPGALCGLEAGHKDEPDTTSAFLDLNTQGIPVAGPAAWPVKPPLQPLFPSSNHRCLVSCLPYSAMCHECHGQGFSQQEVQRTPRGFQKSLAFMIKETEAVGPIQFLFFCISCREDVMPGAVAATLSSQGTKDKDKTAEN